MANPGITLLGGFVIGVGFTVVTTLVIAPPLSEWFIRRRGALLLSQSVPGGIVSPALAQPIADVLAPKVREAVRHSVTPWES